MIAARPAMPGSCARRRFKDVAQPSKSPVPGSRPGLQPAGRRCQRLRAQDKLGFATRPGRFDNLRFLELLEMAGYGLAAYR